MGMEYENKRRHEMSGIFLGARRRLAYLIVTG
jgi:hypothetical protein